MMDMDSVNLNSIYKHCDEMLHNTSPYAPGKLIIRENIHRT